MLRHPKFKNERVCDGCGCSFLPEKGYEKVQKMCLGCSELPELPKDQNKKVGDVRNVVNFLSPQVQQIQYAKFV